MQLTDLTVEVRDSNLARVGQLNAADLVGSKFIPRFNNVGSWEVKLPYGNVLADLLRTPGYGLVVTGPSGVLLSGAMRSAKLEQTQTDPEGIWTISGVDDSVVLTERLGYPQPSNADVQTQTLAHDVRAGFAETVLKGYVEDNISLYAGTVRAIDNLDIEPDAERGALVSGSARFDTLQELFYPIAQTGGIGYTIEQNGDLLEFQVYEPVDRTATIRMDVDNGNLAKTQYVYQIPKTTRAIVAGAGEAIDRLFYEGTSVDSLAAESLWGRRIETFVDDRGSDFPDELVQKADETLVDDGKTIVNLSVTPSDDQNMRFGFDWGLGDKVTVVVGSVEASAVVTEVGISIQADGVRIGATVGTPVATSFESKVVAKVSEQETRISNLERNTTGYGINVVYQAGGGTDGTQPVFPANAISASYNRFGNMVHFNISVDFTNITNFGTGHYYVTLPYPTRVRYTFANGHFFDTSSSKSYNFVGEADANSQVVWLFYIGSNGQMDNFTSTNPTVLTTADKFDISGTYEIEA